MNDTELTERTESAASVPSAASGPMALMRIIDRAATDPNLDVEKLQKLLDVKQQWEREESRKAFVKAMNAFKANPPKIKKNATVDYQPQGKPRVKYDHATLDHVCDVIGEALSRHGISYRWDVRQESGAVTVTCILTHEQGHSESVPMTAPPDQTGGKNNIQAVGSTVTYLQRYTLLAATGMAVEGQDDDGGKAEDTEQPRITKAQANEIERLIKDVGANRTQFIGWLRTQMKAKSVPELPAQAYDDVVAKLESKRRATEKKAKGAENDASGMFGG